MSTHLALDLGASSGRAVLGTLSGGGAMTMDEIARFETPMRTHEDGHVTWDVEALAASVDAAVARALAVAPELRSVSVDAWGVDYVPVGADGVALRDPYAYRDPRTVPAIEAAHARMPFAELYRETGIQHLPFNTVYQVLADAPAERARTATRLFIADALNHRLGGRAVTDATVASTSGLLDVRTGAWSQAVLGRLGLGMDGWPEIVAPGTVTGRLRGAGHVAVVASCGHDTACAVAAVPADEAAGPWAYASLGTWSLVGVERASPLASDAACTAGVTNERGFGGPDGRGTIRLLRNVTGLWLLTECARAWSDAPARFDGSLDALLAAADASAYAGTFDPDDATLAPPNESAGPMPARIAGALARADAAPPETGGDIVRAILKSLARAHADRLGAIAALTGEAPRVVHAVGGGSRNALLCRWTADACGVPVVAGPAEATALGNLLVQAHATGDLRALDPDLTVRAAARASAQTVTYSPVLA